MYDIQNPISYIPIGNRRDFGHTVQFDLTAWAGINADNWKITYMRPGESATYPAPDGDVSVADNVLTWTISEAVTALDGAGSVIIEAYRGGDMLKHSIRIMTIIGEGHEPAGEAPDPVADWIREADAKLDEVDESLERANSAEDLRETAEIARETAEGLRVSAETSRNTAEGLRGSAETARKEAEALRVAAEAARMGFKPMGAYNPANENKYGEWYTHEGGSYGYIWPEPSAGVPLTDTTHWQQIASMGGQDLVDAAVAAKNTSVSAKDTAVAAAAQLQAGIGSPAGKFANLAAVNAANPAHDRTYLTEDDWKIALWDETAGAFVAGGVYQAAAIADGSVTPKNLSFLAVQGEASLNLFDPGTVTNGYFLNSGNGSLTANEDYCVSDYIPIGAGVAGIATSRNYSCYYRANKTFISGVGYTTEQGFTTPAETAYMRVSCLITNKNTYQLVLGSLLPTTYVSHKPKIVQEAFSASVINFLSAQALLSAKAEYDPIIYNGYLKQLSIDLSNPFIRTQIKLNGDSITAGYGTTGYALSGALIPGTAYYIPVNTSSCWASLLNSLVAAKYNGVKLVSMLNKHITYTATPLLVSGDDPDTITRSYVRMSGDHTGYGFEFDVYGTYFDIIYTKNPTTGIFDIYVDDVKVATVDTYASSTTYQNEEHVTFSAGKHHVKVIETYTKNSSSTGYSFQIEGIRVTKIATVLNYGIVGVQSIMAGNASIVTSADDYAIIALGINDRSEVTSSDVVRQRLVHSINKVRALGVKPILMSTPPVSVAQEQNTATYHFGAVDVDMAVREAATQCWIPYISQYDHFVQYAELMGVTVDSLLGDGLHPNDAGSKVMFNNFCRCTGLPVLRDGVSL